MVLINNNNNMYRVYFTLLFYEIRVIKDDAVKFIDE